MSTAIKKKPSLAKLLLGNLLVTAVLLLLAECGYRGVLNHRNQKPEVPYYFFATSGAILEYDADLSYNYVPNHLSHSAVIKQGRVVRLYTNRVNSVGMTTREDTYDPKAAQQILVVGDSFTALTYSDAIWTDWMHDALEAKGENVSVTNAGRDGYGVLQMVHSAARIGEKQRFDDLVIAFISDDLTRDRFWRHHLADAQPPRVVTTTQTGATPQPPYVDTYLLDPRVTSTWVESMLAEPDRQTSDPLLADLIRTVQERRRAFQTLPRLGGGSVLWNRLVHGDPYFTLNRQGRNPRHALMSFLNDRGFQEDAATIRKRGGRIHLVHIPDMEELRQGAYRNDARLGMLRESLAHALDTPVLELLPRLEIAPDTVEDFFLVPHDTHPNASGMRRIGESVAALLMENVAAR